MLGQLLLLWAAAAAAGDANPPNVELSDARNYVGKTINVTFVVRSVSNSSEALLILNSRLNPRDQENFAVVVLREDSQAFRQTHWDNLPAAVARFKDQKVNATGKVRRRGKRYELIVRKRAQLTSFGNPS